MILYGVMDLRARISYGWGTYFSCKIIVRVKAFIRLISLYYNPVIRVDSWSDPGNYPCMGPRYKTIPMADWPNFSQPCGLHVGSHVVECSVPGGEKKIEKLCMTSRDWSIPFLSICLRNCTIDKVSLSIYPWRITNAGNEGANIFGGSPYCS